MSLFCFRYTICLLAHEKLMYNLKYKSHESSKKKQCYFSIFSE